VEKFDMFLKWLLILVAAFLSTPAWCQASGDEKAMRDLPQAFSKAWAAHDGRELAKIVSEDVAFVNVGAIWLQGREDFEKYHSRILQGRFKKSTIVPLDTNIRLLRPDLALVRWSWRIDGETDSAGAGLPPRHGLMTFLAEKRAGQWLVIAGQNTNAGPSRPEAADLKAPITVPRNP
jgi:uncharacterized protein (TIGR02246 family)